MCASRPVHRAKFHVSRVHGSRKIRTRQKAKSPLKDRKQSSEEHIFLIKVYIYLLFFLNVKRIYQAFQCKKPEVNSPPYSRAIKVLSGSTAIFVFKNHRHRLFASPMVTLTKITNQPFVLSTCGFFM